MKEIREYFEKYWPRTIPKPIWETDVGKQILELIGLREREYEIEINRLKFMLREVVMRLYRKREDRNFLKRYANLAGIEASFLDEELDTYLGKKDVESVQTKV